MPSQTFRFAVVLFLMTLLVLLAGCTARKASSPATTNVAASPSGKVLIHFKEFEFGKDWSADFEVTNDTNEPISYVGDKTYRFAYCTLAAKRTDHPFENAAFTLRNFCTLGNRVSLQTLAPGQSIVLAAEKAEIRDLLYKNDASATVAAQIGFEVFVGNDRHRDMVWTEQISFPNEDPR